MDETIQLKALLAECTGYLEKLCSEEGLTAEEFSAVPGAIKLSHQLCEGMTDTEISENRLAFFFDALDEMLSYQSKENRVSNTEVAGALLFKILELWEDMRALCDEGQDNA